MAASLIPLILMASLTIGVTLGFILPKRTLSDNPPTIQDYYDYPDKYDDYPVVKVAKRAALLLDRLMVALQNAVEDEDKPRLGIGATDSRSVRATGQSNNIAAPSTSLMADKSGIIRRAQGKGRVYWRCYFNAVTCFK